jgi:hypothetical protein
MVSAVVDAPHEGDAASMGALQENVPTAMVIVPEETLAMNSVTRHAERTEAVPEETLAMDSVTRHAERTEAVPEETLAMNSVTRHAERTEAEARKEEMAMEADKAAIVPKEDVTPSADESAVGTVAAMDSQEEDDIAGVDARDKEHSAAAVAATPPPPASSEGSYRALGMLPATIAPTLALEGHPAGAGAFAGGLVLPAELTALVLRGAAQGGDAAVAALNAVLGALGSGASADSSAVKGEQTEADGVVLAMGSNQTEHTGVGVQRHVGGERDEDEGATTTVNTLEATEIAAVNAPGKDNAAAVSVNEDELDERAKEDAKKVKNVNAKVICSRSTFCSLGHHSGLCNTRLMPKMSPEADAEADSEESDAEGDVY